MHFAHICQGIESDFVGLGKAIVQNGLGLIDIFFEEVGAIDGWSVGDWEGDVFYFEGGYVVVCFCCLADVEFMVLGADVGEYLRTVIYLGFNLLLEEVGFWD